MLRDAARVWRRDHASVGEHIGGRNAYFVVGEPAQVKVYGGMEFILMPQKWEIQKAFSTNVRAMKDNLLSGKVLRVSSRKLNAALEAQVEPKLAPLVVGVVGAVVELFCAGTSDGLSLGRSNVPTILAVSALECPEKSA
eukprot:10849561-Ditylum_brightwellii.AAC.1